MIDPIEPVETLRESIRNRIDYDSFRNGKDCHTEEVDELVELILEVLMLPDTSTLRIAGTDKPVMLIKSRFQKIGYGHIQYVLECLKKNTTKVGNIRAYLLTTLYNATMTINNYYQAEVNHDLYGSG